MPFRRRPLRRRRRVRGHRKPGLSFTKKVLKIVNKSREMKISRPMNTALNLNVMGSILLANNNVLPLMPLISQGDNEYDRTGNQVTLHKIKVNAYYKMQSGQITNQQARVMIRHMVVRQRDTMNAQNIISGVVPFGSNLILENATAYLGSITNYNTPLNKAAFISRRQIKKIMTSPVADATGLNTGGDNSSSYFMVTYTLTFGKGKTLHYGTGGATSPANFGYFLMHSAAGLGSNVVLPVGSVVYNMTTTAYYTDA